MKLMLIVILLFGAAFEASFASDPEKCAMAIRLYSDPKARCVGDILTVIVEEETIAEKGAKSSSKKTSTLGGSVNFGHPRLDDRETSWTNAVVPSYALDTSRQFDGEGSLENSDKFESKISVTVTDVMPNGNLIIEGSRVVDIQDERMQVILSGTVRSTDVGRDNTVLSTTIADASIQYVSIGQTVKNQRMGAVTRFWNWVNPF